MAERLDSIAWSRQKWKERQGPAPEAFAAMVGTLRFAQLVRARLEQLLREHDLTLTTYLIFATLWLEHDRTLTLGTLSRRLMLHPTTVSLVVDKTHARGLATRARHPSDRRTVLVSLTDEGEHLLTVLSETLSRMNYGLAGVDDTTTASVVETITRALNSMGDR